MSTFLPKPFYPNLTQTRLMDRGGVALSNHVGEGFFDLY